MDSSDFSFPFLKFYLTVILGGILGNPYLLRGQDLYNSLNFTNPLLINSSFAGLTGGSSVITTLNSTYFGQNDLFNEFGFTFDSFSEKLKGGIGLVYKQNIYGNINLNTTEAGLIYSRKFTMGNGKIIPSIYFGYKKAVKNWYVYLLDVILNRQLAPPNPPGNVFQRFDVVIPGFGVIIDAPTSQFGIFMQNNSVINLPSEEGISSLPPRITTFFSRKMKGEKNGLISQPFLAYAEAVLHYENKLFQSRIAFKVDQRDKIISLFNLNNYTDKIFFLGGTYGLKIDILQLSFTGAAGLPLFSKEFTYSGEISLGIYLTRSNNNSFYPFAPVIK